MSNDVRSELAIEGGEMTIKALRSARTFKNGKHNESELVLKLGFFKDVLEQRCNSGR